MSRLAELHGPEFEDYLSRVYMTMIRLGTPTQEGLELEGYHPDDVRRVGKELVGRGLITEDGPGRWEIQPPEESLPRLAALLEARARFSRSFASELGVIWRQSREGAPDAEVGMGGIEGLGIPDDAAAGMRSVEGMAHRELLMMVADSPAARVWLDRADTTERLERRADTVAMVVDRALLGEPGVLAELERQSAAGASVKVMGAVPFGVVIADHTAALVDLSQHDEQGGGSFLIRRAAVLAGLRALVEVGNTRGVPLTPRPGEKGGRKGMPLDDRDVRILGLLAAGATDQMIARSIGVSTRTVERRIRFLMEHLGGGTRFQAGVQAARRGWF
ncbi:helix-turn-helix transcriptional regulator [Ornithinicoccus hortensis]|uniref:Regulatory LuxR family protein n=1 Tax=Ornithinicoccus hortensis TaxID=82346 RepID=A0A542YW61_9MICO|nr:helix-turn-helix transcriptional regulator [Ornithinicoccus hortensis]TQL52311.1 regulatory LuxR family protein [Ornithinicoccus hortensis]